MKKKAKRVDVPNGTRSSEFEDLLVSIGPDHLKGRISNATREVLDRWVEEIAGQKPDDTHDNEFIAASLCRYIDGDKNWGDDPKRVANLNRKRRVVAEAEEGNPDGPEEDPATEAEWKEEETTHGQAETPEGEKIMKTNGNGKVAAKTPAEKNGKKAVEKKSIPPKPEKVKKEKKASVHPVGKTTGSRRMAWFLDVLRNNGDAKLSDAKIDALAVKEFGAENIPGDKGTFSASHLRGWFIYCRKAGRGGVKKSDTFPEHNEK